MSVNLYGISRAFRVAYRPNIGAISIGFMAFFMIFFINSAFAYQIDGNSVFIDDSRAYISVTPHTLYSSGYVYYTIKSKVYSGDVDVVFGFNTETGKPKTAEYYNPGFYDIPRSFECSPPYWFNFTLNPNHFWCYVTLGSGDHELIFHHDFDTYDNQENIAYWNEQKYREWVDISDKFTSVNYLLDGKDKWYYVKNFNINQNQEYKIRTWVDVPVCLSSNAECARAGKYDIAIKPSALSIQEAVSQDKLYYIDPWFNASWDKSRAINVWTTDGTAPKPYVLFVNLTYDSDMNNDFSDVRFVATNNITVYPHYFLTNVTSKYAEIYVNITDFNITTTNTTIYVYYDNPSAKSTSTFSGVWSFNSIDFDTYTDGVLVGQDNWIDVGGAKGDGEVGSNATCNARFDGHKCIWGSSNGVGGSISLRRFLDVQNVVFGNLSFIVFITKPDTSNMYLLTNPTSPKANINWRWNSGENFDWYDGVWRTNLFFPSAGSFQKFEFKCALGTTNTCNVYLNDSFEYKGTFVDPADLDRQDVDESTGNNPDIFFSSFYWRPFIEPEPLHFIGAEIQQPVVSQNTTAIGVKFNLTGFQFASSTFVPGLEADFNTTEPSTTFAILSAMNIIKLTGGGTNIVSTRISIDDQVIHIEDLRTVSTIDTEGAAGTRPISFSVGPGEHNITCEFARTGNGNIEINDADLVFLEDKTPSGNNIRLQVINSTSSFGDSTTYNEIFNWTINKSIQSGTYVTTKHDAQKTTPGLALVSMVINNSFLSPFYGRVLSGASDIGSFAGGYIDNETSGIAHIFEILARHNDAGDIVTSEFGTLDMDMRDNESEVIQHFFTTIPGTSLNGTSQTLNAGLSLLSEVDVTPVLGDAYYVSFTTTFQSNSGAQTPTYFVNSTNTSISCFSKKERTLASSNDFGNAFVYTVCDGMVVNQEYTIQFWAEVGAGESVLQWDEAFMGFEITTFDIRAENLPPLPNEITNPGDGDLVTGADTITWLAFDNPEDGVVTYNITLNNLNGSLNLTLGTGISGLSLGVNWSQNQTGDYLLVVTGIDNVGLFSNTTISITIFQPGPIIVFVPVTSETFCFNSNVLLIKNAENESVGGVSNLTIREEFINCQFGCSNSTLSTYGNPGCIESPFTQALFFIGLVILVVGTVRLFK